MEKEAIKAEYRKYLFRDPSELDFTKIESSEQLSRVLKNCDERKEVEKVLNMISRCKIPTILYKCSIGTSGYAVAARCNIFTLLSLGFPVRVEVIGMQNVNLEPSEDEKIIYSLTHLKFEPDIIIHHSTPGKWQKEKGKINIGLTVWEFDTLSKQWIEKMNQMDRIFTPSFANVLDFKSQLQVPVSLFKTQIRQKPITKQSTGKFTFYTIAEWSNRKSIDELIQCFSELFTNNDDVALYIKTNREKNITLPKNITVDIRNLTDSQLQNIHAKGDCYISLSKGEGTGLGACDACLAGNQLILTDCSGHNEYIKNFHVVDTISEEINMCDSFPEHSECKNGICKIYPWFTKEMKWRKPKLDSAKKKMEEVYKGSYLRSRLSDNNFEITDLIFSLIK